MVCTPWAETAAARAMTEMMKRMLIDVMCVSAVD